MSLSFAEELAGRPASTVRARVVDAATLGTASRRSKAMHLKAVFHFHQGCGLSTSRKDEFQHESFMRLQRRPTTSHELRSDLPAFRTRHEPKAPGSGHAADRLASVPTGGGPASKRRGGGGVAGRRAAGA